MPCRAEAPRDLADGRGRSEGAVYTGAAGRVQAGAWRGSPCYQLMLASGWRNPGEVGRSPLLTEPPMVDILIRDVKPETHATLKKRAAEAGTSMEQYLRDVLDRAASMTPEEFLEFARHVRASLAKGGYRDPRDSLELIREDRRRP